jgi:uncharacterized protein YjdB
MKKQTKALWRILAATLLFGFTSLFITGCDSGGGGGGGGGTAPVTGVSLDKTTLTISVGDMETLKATVTPDDAISKSVTWSSSNASVARVSSSGVVTGVSAGYAIVTVTTVSGSRMANCYVIVSALTSTVTSVTVSPSSVSVEKGKTQQFSAVVNGNNNPSQTVSWSVTGGVSGTSISWSDGLLTVAANETAATLTVTARSSADYNKNGTATVTVTDVTIGPNQTFSSANDFGRWLSSQPTNTENTPYNVKLNVNSAAGIGDILRGEPKYVYLDLSGSTMTTIPDEAFYNCYRLTRITIPNSVISIGERAFTASSSYYPRLNTLTIGNSVTSIGKQAFDSCAYLTSVTIPNSVKNIGVEAFDGCTRLVNLTIGNGVTSIGNEAFSACTSLTSVIIPNSVTSIGEWAFYRCSNLASLTIENGVTTIGNYAFNNCRSLTSITIPNSVISIGEAIFGDCNYLASATIGSGITSIGYGAFRSCTRLLSVTFQGSIPSSGFDSSAFSSIGDLRDKYYASGGGSGTYTRSSGALLWYKQ